ncbi:protein ROH1D-like [Rosa rugosa]|uniref:protein ROH1D-like n=1 Tax=Rosa rugosa TaxID=74645 RepID=UPI002B417E2D|nr:protein ROH1D-like [Rosa rugosa]
MPSTHNHAAGSSSPLTSLGRSIWTRREQCHSVEDNHESSAQELELQSFQKHVADLFHDLSGVGADELLSIAWTQKLLDVFISCLEEFRGIFLKNKEDISKPPMDHWTDAYLDRSLKALDICNAARDGIDKIRMWHKHLEIVLCALDSRQRPYCEGQFRRARKALMDLALEMLDGRDSGSAFSQRNWSFGRHNTRKDRHRRTSSGHSRSHSWSISASWSAAKQLQSIANNLVAPRGNENAATNGLVGSIFTMSSVLMFVLSALVAAIPCQDRGLNTQFSIPPQYSWGIPLISLHERIMEESKKRERQSSNGLLKEIYQVEKCTRHMTDFVDLVQFPLTEEQKMELEQVLEELASICEKFKNGLGPLERQIRDVFRRILNCRTEGLELLSKGSNLE